MKYILSIIVLVILTVFGLNIDLLYKYGVEKKVISKYSIGLIDLLHGGKRVEYDNRIQPETYSLSFEGLAVDDNYDNFFQFADSNSIQLELQHPGKLFLKVGDDHMYQVSDDIQMNRWYRYDLYGEYGKYVRFNIDGKLAFESRSDEVVNKKLDFHRLLFGSGYADQRGLQGEIRNLTFTVKGIKESRLKIPLLILVGGSIGSAFVYLFRRTFPIEERGSASMPDSSAFQFMPMMMIYLIAVIIGFEMMKTTLPYGKWSLLFASGVVLGMTPFMPVCTNVRCSNLARGAMTGMTLILLILIFVFLAENPRPFIYDKIAGIFLELVSSLALGIALLMNQGHGGLRKATAIATAKEFSFFVLIALCTVLSFSDLQNWTLIIEALRDAPGRTAMLVILGSFIVVYLTDRITVYNQSNQRHRLLQNILVSLMACMVFVAISLRTDVLFTGSSMMHWEYYVGVVRSIRNGGWLLYDTPSQYGFIPMLLAAASPVRSSWDAFYWMQSITMVAAALLLYTGLIRFARMPALFALSLSMFLVFFSYPGLIGPAPYPSSGPMRFIWCYVLLYCAGHVFIRNQPTAKKYMVIALPFWILGVLWSGESAVYSSSIYFAPIGGALFKRIADLKTDVAKQHRNIFESVIIIVVPVVALVGVMLAISAIYLHFLGVWPDWSMHFAYGFAYAKGFGEVDMPANGPVWSLLFLMMVGFMAVWMSIKSEDSDNGRWMLALAAIACIWSVSSYYFGRAVPNNIVAVFPVLVFAAILIMRSWPHDESRTVPVAVIGVFVFVSYISPLSNKDLSTLIRKMDFSQLSVIPNMAKADPELLGLMKKAGVTDSSRVVYYGNDAAFPAMAGMHGAKVIEGTWLPNPLQLLEAPVPEERQKELIARWASRRLYAGYLIHRKGDAEDRLGIWRQVLSAAYEEKSSWDSEKYRIILFSRK